MNPHLPAADTTTADAPTASELLMLSRGYRSMTDLEHRAALAAAPGRVRYPVASPPKRLARTLAQQATPTRTSPNGWITDRQAWALWRLVYTFRRQFSREHADILAHAFDHHTDPCPPRLSSPTIPGATDDR